MSTTTVDEGVVTFTPTELTALLAMRPGRAATLSRRALRLDEDPEHEHERDGLRSLLARRLVVAEEAGPRPVEAASVVGYAVTGATRWTTLMMESPDSSGTVLVVESDQATLLLTPRPPGLFDVVPLDQDTAGLDVVVPSATRWLEQESPCALALVAATPRHEVTVAVGSDDGASYWVSHGGGEHHDLDRAGALHVLRFAVRNAAGGSRR